MKRRDFLAATALLSLLASAPAHATKKPVPKKAPPKPAPKPVAKKPASAAEHGSPQPEVRNVISLPDEPQAQWRTYDLRSTIALNGLPGKTRLWLPLAQYKDTPWERSLGHSWQGNFETAGIYRDPVAEMEVFYADWPEGTESARLEVVSQVATQNRHFDITRRGAMAERTEVLRRSLQPTELIPVDGIVRRTAERAIGRIKDPLAIGKAIYDWVVDNTVYDPSIKDSAIEPASALLDSGDLRTNSTGIALLFVALCRAIGLPARPVFGIRVDMSRLFGSLGSFGNLSEAQHCRAEFYTPGYGWIPVNPADVRIAMREEQLGAGDPKLTVLRKLLFGFWEMNWISFNAAEDVVLRGSRGTPLPFLIGPQVETAGGKIDLLDKQRFNYRVTASRADT